MAKVTKLGIGIVTQGQMEAQTACALISALPNAGVPFQMILAMGCYIQYNRMNAVNIATENQCSHLLFVDTDMFFDQMAIKKLIDHAENGLDIIGARYNKRVYPVVSTVPDITELSSVPFCPTGFLLINMEVFAKIGTPYFWLDEKVFPDSEDAYFCRRAIECGYKVWCDPLIQIGHLGTTIY